MRLIRRSRTAVGVLAAALLVSASGCGTDSPEGLDATTAPATTPATTTEPTAPSTTTTPAESTPPTTDESTEIVMVRSTGSPANSPFEVAGDDDGPSPMRWLAPWDDGFLAIGGRLLLLRLGVGKLVAGLEDPGVRSALVQIDAVLGA